MENREIFAEFAHMVKEAPDGAETAEQWLRKLEFLDTLQAGLSSVCCGEIGNSSNPVTDASRLSAYVSMCEILQIIRSKTASKTLDAMYKRAEWAKVQSAEVAMLHYDDIDDIQARLPPLVDNIDTILTRGDLNEDGYEQKVAALLLAFLDDKRESIAEVSSAAIGEIGGE